MTDQKYRNAYKRHWRNKKNWERRQMEAVDLVMASKRSYRLMMEAATDMDMEKTQ